MLGELIEEYERVAHVFNQAQFLRLRNRCDPYRESWHNVLRIVHSPHRLAVSFGRGIIDCFTFAGSTNVRQDYRPRAVIDCEPEGAIDKSLFTRILCIDHRVNGASLLQRIYSDIRQFTVISICETSEHFLARKGDAMRLLGTGLQPCMRVPLCLILALSGCSRSRPDVKPAPPPVVRVSSPLERQVTDYEIFTARTAAVQSVDINPRVSGYLTKINFKDGEEIKKGEVLFEIDDRTYRAQLAQAKASLKFSQASLIESQAEYDIGSDLSPLSCTT